MKSCLITLLLVLVTGVSSAGITVEVVDYPERVSVYSPMLVTARVVNHGPDPELIPMKGMIQTGSTPETLSWYEPVLACGGGALKWLKPGEAWLFQADLGRFWDKNAPGDLHVAAGIQSNGECLYSATGAETFPLTLAHETPTRSWYECWSGEVLSGVVRITIEPPSEVVDKEALRYFEENHYLGGLPNAGVWTGSALLLEKYPTSSVTYAIGLQHCKKSPSCLQRLLDEQPSHPLTAHTRFTLAMALRDTRPESESKEAWVEALNLPDGLAEYLLQEMRR